MVFAAVGLATSAAFGAVDWRSNPVQSGQGHRALVGDYSGGKVCIIDADGKVEWQYPAKNANDAWMLPNGNVLFNSGRGVKEVTPAKEIVFEYESKGEVYTCQRLPNGNTLVGDCIEGQLLEVDPAGKVVKTIDLPKPQLAVTPAENPAQAAKKGKKKKPVKKRGPSPMHSYMRDARQLANGNYLVSHIADQVAREYDPSGKLLREIPAPGGAHSAIRLPNGNTLISCGDKSKTATVKVLEVDPAGKVVWSLDADELPGIKLCFMTGLQRLPNGNTVMTNWLGHGNNRKSAHIIEVTPAKEVVWTHQDFDAIKTATCIQVLDLPGNAIHGEILR
jgi:hypothetical protein